MGNFLLQNVWIITILFGLASLADYYLTIYGARLLRTNLSEQIKYEGSYELTPVFRKDVDALKLFSPQFAWRWLLSMALIPAMYWIFFYGFGMPFFFLFLTGGMFLRHAAILMRHARNIASGLLAREPGSIQGSVQYAQRLSLRLSAVELWSFAVFYLIIAVVANSAFFYGGALITAITGLQHWNLARKPNRAAPAPASDPKP